MSHLSRRLISPLCLTLGALLAGVAAGLHPVLTGDGATQLAAIAQCGAWRAIHWAFLLGFPLSLTGLVDVAARHAGTPGEGAARAGVIVGTFAYGAWMVIVALMAGAGWSLAQRFTAAPAGPTATVAVFLFDALRPFGLATQRVAGFALGLATALLGWGVMHGKALPRWLGAGGLVAGMVGILLALLFREDTKADQAAFVLPVLWQLVTGAVLLRGRPAAA
jgi:uncharacterized membrane protein